jgi:hypothetical protein
LPYIYIIYSRFYRYISDVTLSVSLVQFELSDFEAWPAHILVELDELTIDAVKDLNVIPMIK